MASKGNESKVCSKSEDQERRGAQCEGDEYEYEYEEGNEDHSQLSVQKNTSIEGLTDQHALLGSMSRNGRKHAKEGQQVGR